MADLGTRLNVICLESEAFYTLIDEVVERVNKEQNIEQDDWISDAEAMKLLRISSKTTLQKYRDEGKIRFSQLGRKSILYDRQSLLDFIESNARDTF